MKICTCLIPNPVSPHDMTCSRCGGKINEICMFRGESGYCYDRGTVKIGYYYYCAKHAAQGQKVK